MRPPRPSASIARGSAAAHTDSSALTSIRSAWKVRLPGCPPLFCDVAGTTFLSSSTRRPDVVNGSSSRSRTMAPAILRANRSSPKSRSTVSSAPAS